MGAGVPVGNFLVTVRHGQAVKFVDIQPVILLPDLMKPAPVFVYQPTAVVGRLLLQTILPAQGSGSGLC